MKEKELGFATKAIHVGQKPDPKTGAVMVPVYQTSTYAQHAPGEPYSHFEYSRTGNPTREALETSLAALEGAEYGLCFASGCAALTSILHLFETGDHVIFGDDVYGGTYRIFDNVFSKYQLQSSAIDLSDLSALENAINPNTKMVWLETPTNPMLKVFDIQAIVDICKKKSKEIIIGVDNTFATPYLQNPITLGADLVCHSTTKYIGGHSDIIGGAVMVNDKALADKLYYLQNAIGATPSPMDCFLLLRSVKTLSVRMDKHCENAMQVAKFLEKHDSVERVIYPGLKSHPQYQLAKKQMRNFGGMISFLTKGNKESVLAFFKQLKLFCLAESLGGVESLAEYPAIMTHAAIPKAHRDALGISDQLIRLSVGIESADDLIHDLDGALSG